MSQNDGQAGDRISNMTSVERFAYAKRLASAQIESLSRGISDRTAEATVDHIIRLLEELCEISFPE